jgi:anti-sigma factor RsiW
MTADHLPAEDLAAYLSRGQHAPAFQRVQAHLADCAECRQEAAHIARVVRAETRGRMLRWTGAGGAAAAAVLVLAVWAGGHRRAPDTDITRGPAGSPVEAAALAPLAPLGEVSPAASQLAFAWRSVAGVVEYRLTLSNATGGTLWRRATTDTTLVLPLEVSLARGVSYYWYVDALVAAGGSVTSGAREFHLQP